MIRTAPRRLHIALALIAALAAGPALAADPASLIDSSLLRAHVRFLASDLLGGRGPGSSGDELARAYLATQLEALGLRPGSADGSYQQRFEMVGVATEAPPTWSFLTPAGAVELRALEDYVATNGAQAPDAGFENAELLFVGYGIQAPEFAWDDFKGEDVRGKVLVFLNSDPDWDPALFEGERRLYYGRWTYKYEIAARLGAAGAIIVHTTASAGYPWQVVETSWTGEQFELPADGSPRVGVTAWITESGARRILTAAGHEFEQLVATARDRSFRPVPLGVRTSLRVGAELRRIETANVLGLLPGGDPALADEVVIYTAHHDHLGIGQPDAEGDSVYNGAIDNATGCAQLLGIARAMAALPVPPRRSILFLFVAAEEQGLLGSQWYAEHPTFPAGRIAANINLDAGNVFGRTADVIYVGYGKSSLDAVLEEAASRQGRYVVGDALPDRGFFYRSDQLNFARIGVPALYIDGGREFVGREPEFGRGLQERYESTCYHQPCDEIADEWDLAGLVLDARLGFECGLAIARADAMPQWNPGDEFEATRLEALRALEEN